MWSSVRSPVSIIKKIFCWVQTDSYTDLPAPWRTPGVIPLLFWGETEHRVARGSIFVVCDKAEQKFIYLFKVWVSRRLQKQQQCQFRAPADIAVFQTDLCLELFPPLSPSTCRKEGGENTICNGGRKEQKKQRGSRTEAALLVVCV